MAVTSNPVAASVSVISNSFIKRVPIYRIQSIDLRSKSIDWFIYDKNFRHDRVNLLKCLNQISLISYKKHLNYKFIKMNWQHKNQFYFLLPAKNRCHYWVMDVFSNIDELLFILYYTFMLILSFTFPFLYLFTFNDLFLFSSSMLHLIAKIMWQRHI